MNPMAPMPVEGSCWVSVLGGPERCDRVIHPHSREEAIIQANGGGKDLRA